MPLGDVGLHTEPRRAAWRRGITYGAAACRLATWDYIRSRGVPLGDVGLHTEPRRAAWLYILSL